MNKNNEINEDINHITLKVLSKIAINVINTGLGICSLVLHENRLFF